MSDASMTSGIRGGLMQRVHVLRECGKVLADQLNFHEEGETRHYGATYHDKRGRGGLGRCYVRY